MKKIALAFAVNFVFFAAPSHTAAVRISKPIPEAAQHVVTKLDSLGTKVYQLNQVKLNSNGHEK